MDVIHYKIKVKGRVQGVWFRKYTKDKADILDLKGFVRNEPNGEVYVEVEGDKKAVDEFYKWLFIGSPKSKVTDVLRETDDMKDYKLFEISR